MKNANVLLPFVDKDVRSSAVEDPIIKTTFLFVNKTTSSSQAFKIGGRQDIRSHVRKHVANRFRHNHKDGRAVNAKESKVVRYPLIAPQAFAQSEYSNIQHCEHDLQLTSSAWQPGSGYLWRIATATNFIKPKEFSASASSSDPPGGTEQSDVKYMPPTSTENRVYSSSNILGGDTVHDELRFFCPTCGSHISSAKRDEIEQKGAIAVARRAAMGRTFDRSLAESLASGRVDPFMSYPVDKPTPQLHELIDHAVTYLLPGLIPDGPSHAVNAVSKAWLSTGLEHPLVFHALVFAGSIHLDFLRTSKIFPNSPQALSHKLIVIQKLKEIMSNPKKACRDEVILAILVLSSHETQDQSQVRCSPFNSPLQSAQWLNIYGNIRYVPEHMQAVLDIIKMRGGLEKLELHGLAETIAGGDVLSSTQNLAKPVLPPLKISEHWMGTLMSWAKEPPRMPILKLGRGFRDLRGYCITENAMYVFDAIAALTIAMEHYLEGEPAGLSLGALSKARTAVQYRLLSLQNSKELDGATLLEPDIYEACRLIVIIYGIAVVFPIPNSYKALQQLVQLLQDSITTCGVDKLGKLQPNLLLWMLMLGAIAAFEKPERLWYVTQLAGWANKWEIQNWEEIEERLLLFLWLESACGSGGRRVWTEVTIWRARNEKLSSLLEQL